MRRRTIPILTCVIFIALALCAQRGGSVRSEETIRLRQITVTPPHSLSINPTMSGDGAHIVFESTANSYDATGTLGFRLLQADIADSSSSVRFITSTRAPAPAQSQNGHVIAFAAADDPLGSNPDRNSEIFILNDGGLRQLTSSISRDTLTRTLDGNFNPSVSDDGRFTVFSSACNITNRNPDFNHEIILYDQATNAFTQLTDSSDIYGATDAKISGDGSRIAYILHATNPVEDVATPRRLMVYERSSNSTRALVSDTPNLAITYGRALSDDGSRIVFSANTAANSSQVFVFDFRLNIPPRQITRLGSRSDDVPLHPSISGDGTRIAFATRRTVEGFSNSDRSVELYLYDFPLAQFTKITDAPATAVAEVVSSINDDGTLVAFNFPRVLTSAPSNAAFVANSEIYLASLPPRPPPSQDLIILNAASLEFASPPTNTIALESIAVARGRNLTLSSAQAPPNAPLPTQLIGTSITVANRPARLLSVSPTQINFVVPADIPLGAAQVVVTNADRLQTIGIANITHAAPGIFTTNADGQGEAVTLDARTLQAPPFDPLDIGGSARRVFVFTTGVRGASVVSASLDDKDVEVKNVLSVSGMPGLDQVEILLPRTLANRGRLPLRITADGRTSNTTFLRIAGILINELLADPPEDAAGDANRDGVRSASDDEFIELVNSSSSDLQIGGYELFVRNTSGADVLRHRFADNIIAAGTSIVIFGGASEATFNPANPIFAGARVALASSGSLGLPNGGSLITLRDPARRNVDELTYGSLGGASGNDNQSITRSPDVRGDFTLHMNANSARLFSPGTRTDGTPFIPTPPVSRVILEPATAILSTGEMQQFVAQALDSEGAELPGVIFRWETSDERIARVNQDGQVTAIAPGAVAVMAIARGVRSAPVTITVNAPAPSVVRVEVTPSTFTLNRGATATFAARAFGRNGMEISGAIFSFTTANPHVARIDGSSAGTSVVLRGGGFGRTTIRATTSDGAGGTISNEAIVDIEIPLSINEILADVPPDDAATVNIEGDANRDGVRNGGDDEFIELVNTSAAPVDLSRIRIADAANNRFNFPENTTLAAGQAAIVFGGGSPPARDPAFGGALIFTASSLGLNDAGDTVTLKVPLGDMEAVIATLLYPSAGVAPAPANESLTRSPDAGQNRPLNNFVAHRTATNAAGRLFSPGTRTDGSPFNSPPLTRVEITSSIVMFEIGESRSFTARALSIADGIEIEVPNTSFIWEASDPRIISIAPLTGATTNVTALRSGTIELRARAGGIQGSATLTVKPTVASIVLTPDGASIVEGNSTTFTATARDAEGVVVPNISFDFSLRNALPSDAANIAATTTDTATVRGSRAGSVRIVARYTRPRDGIMFEDVSTLTIEEAPRVTRIEVQPTEASILTGGQQQFTARAFDQRGSQIENTGFVWRSSVEAVAAINAEGLANGIGEGSTQITASAAGVTSNPAVLIVRNPPPRIARVEVTPLSAIINRGGSQQFGALAFDNDGREVGDTTFTFTSSDPLIATVSNSGLAHGGGVGMVVIRASTSDNRGGTVTGEATLTVRVPVSINEIFADVPTDDTATPEAEGDANRDGVRSADDDEFIELVNTSKAAIDLSGVRIADATSRRFTFPADTMLPAGRAALVFGGGTPPADTAAFGGALVFVTNSLSLNDGGDTLSIRLPLGGAEVVVATQSYGTGEPAPVAPRDQSLTRTPDTGSDSTGGAFVPHTSATNSEGRIFSPGTRTDGTPFGSPPITRIEFDPMAAEFETGETRRFTARAFGSLDGIETEIPNTSFIWEASDSRRLSITPRTGASVNVTGTQAGTIELRAKAGGAQGSAALTIKAVVAAIELTPSNATVAEGSEATFTATARDAEGVIVPGITFDFSLRSASPPDAATITATTADTVTIGSVRAGSVTVVARYVRLRDGATFEDASTLNIEDAPRVTRIEIQPTEASILVGAQQQFTARAFDQREAELTGINFVWRSSVEAVATINAGGLATGASEGSTQITAHAGGIASNPAALIVKNPPPRIARVEVTPASPAINRGGTQTFLARAFDENNREVTGAPFAFSSSNAAIASINADGSAQGGSAQGVGIGTVTIRATTADNRGGNVTGEATLTVRIPLVINEILADVPPDDAATPDVEGDANRDGVRNSGDDEFVELLNNSSEAVDISGVQLTDAVSTRFTFPLSTILAPGRSVIIFGGGTPPQNSSTFGGSLVLTTNALSLNDSGDTVRLRLSVGSTSVQIAEQPYGASGQPNPAPSDQSLTRSPDATLDSTGGQFVAHKDATKSDGRSFSPGIRADGTPFGSPVISRIEVTPASVMIGVGESQIFVARAFSVRADNSEIEVPNVSFIWDATNDAVVTPRIEVSTRVTSIRAGTSTVRARAGGHAGTASLLVNAVVARIELTPETANISASESVTFTARARDANGNEVSDIAFEFSIRDASPPDAASITARTSNTVTVRGEQAGSLTIVARYVRPNDGSVFEETSTLTITVPPMPVAGEVIINEALVSFASSSTQTRADFVELYNTTPRTLDISGLVISFRPGGSANTARSFTLPGAVGSRQTLIQPNSYFVIANGATTFGEARVLDASASNFDLNNTTGGIKIEINSVKLDGLTYQGGSAAPAAEFISYGEGGIFTFTSGTTNDLIRQPNGSDSNNNSTDFRRNGTASSVSPRAANPTIP